VPAAGCLLADPAHGFPVLLPANPAYGSAPPYGSGRWTCPFGIGSRQKPLQKFKVSKFSQSIWYIFLKLSGVTESGGLPKRLGNNFTYAVRFQNNC
jgi:hypothetical protein